MNFELRGDHGSEFLTQGAEKHLSAAIALLKSTRFTLVRWSPSDSQHPKELRSEEEPIDGFVKKL